MHVGGINFRFGNRVIKHFFFSSWYSQILKKRNLLVHCHWSKVPSFSSTIFQVISFLPLTPNPVILKQFWV